MLPGEQMAEQAQQKAQSESSQNSAEIAAVLAVLMAGPPLVMAVQAISAVLKTPVKFVLAAFSILKYKPGKKGSPSAKNPVALARRKNLWFRAAYLLNAVKRLATSDDLKTGLAREKRLYAAHKEAAARRLASAKAVLEMAAETGEDILGWGGILDDRTTADCRWLIGKNFRIDN